MNLANTGLGREGRGAGGKDEGSLWERGLLGMGGRHACVDVCKGVCVHSSETRKSSGRQKRTDEQWLLAAASMSPSPPHPSTNYVIKQTAQHRV